jgi:hypothetical protein
VAAICSPDTARSVSAAMLETLQHAGMTGRSLVTRIAEEGARVSKIELIERP